MSTAASGCAANTATRISGSRDDRERDAEPGDLAGKARSRARAPAMGARRRGSPAPPVTITTKTPYAAKKPSVSSVRPNSRAITTPTTAAKPADDEERRRRQRGAAERAQAGRVCTLAHRRGSVRTMPNDTLWTGAALDELRDEFGGRLRRPHRARHGRRRLHGLAPHGRARRARRHVHAFVRATSSGALNNIGAPPQPPEDPLRRPHRPDVGRLPRCAS